MKSFACWNRRKYMTSKAERRWTSANIVTCNVKNLSNKLKLSKYFFKQTKIIKAKIKCAPKNFLLQWISKFLTKIHGYKRNFVNFIKLCIFHWVCLWFECYENKGFVKMKKRFNFQQEKHDVLNDSSWFCLNPSKIRNRQDLLKPTRRQKIWIYFRGNADLFRHKRFLEEYDSFYMNVSGSRNVKNMIYNIRIVKIKDFQVAMRTSRILNFAKKLWPWTNKDFWRFALSRDHKCLPKLHLIKSRLFQVQVKVSHSRALELHFKWTCTIYLEMTWRVKLNLDTWLWFLLAIPSVDPWTVKHGIRLNNHCAKHFLDKGAVQFLFRISHVDQLLPKIAKNTNC